MTEQRASNPETLQEQCKAFPDRGKVTKLSPSFPFLRTLTNERACSPCKVPVKIVKTAHCTFRIATPSPHFQARDLLSKTCNDQHCESHRGKKAKSGGSDPTFLRQSRPKLRWGRSRPRRIRVGFFSTVQSRGKQSFMHALLNSACRKGETAWQF